MIPESYPHREREPHWAQTWEEDGLYRWDPEQPRERTFVVDTPPPTVSGSLHVGHVFSYTHQDLLVRYQRMRGKNIAYPMGWDDNGLPTERRVQNYFGIQCNPRLPYDPDWQPTPQTPGRSRQEVSRRNFIEACARVTAEDEQAFAALWRRLGLSVDWSLQYATIGEHCRRISQRSFLKLLEQGQAYQTEAPTMWDVDFQTAVAQAEVEDRMQTGAFHDIRFEVEGGGGFTITTTRPELLPACIAVAAHPEDPRYRPLFGKHALTPLFKARVPICPAEHADPEKGTGILMVCTFGDVSDVEFWKRVRLPLKQVLGRNGRFLSLDFTLEPFVSQDPQRAQLAYEELEGQTVKEARRRIVGLLAREMSAGSSALVDAPREVTHPVKFYEKGDRALEFIPTRQWFVRLLEHREELRSAGERVQWHPDNMRVRYQNWVDGLNQDWCISRQRYFGVPFPVWYPLDERGEPCYDRPLTAPYEALPLDPMSQCPPGYTEDQRDQPGGFTGDPDVMDTWATSSLTPQILSSWGEDEDRHQRLFPADIRPQSHEIIRTWAFYTIVKAWMHSRQIPWRHVIISGWILDPDRKKMSKSQGNVVTPQRLLDEYSADGVRYWAARARLGADTTFDEAVLKLGRRLATKLFNASRFLLLQLERHGVDQIPLEEIREPLDQALMASLRALVQASTESLEAFDYAGALQATEQSFWDFCDNYLELVKRRSYEESDTPGRRSALASLCQALSIYVRLFAPFLPFVSEEIWSWRWPGSVHRAPWPLPDDCGSAPGQAALYEGAVELLSNLRKAKTAAKRSLRWEVAHLEVTGKQADLEALAPVLPDVLQAGAVQACRTEVGPAPEGQRFRVRVQLAPGD